MDADENLVTPGPAVVGPAPALPESRPVGHTSADQPVGPTPADPAVGRSTRPLSQAWLGGVCAGLADQLGWPVLVMRSLFVILAATRLVGVGLYLALWLVMPRSLEKRAAPGLEAASRVGKRAAGASPLRPFDLGVASALGLVGVGLTWLVQQSGWGLPTQVFVPALLAATGLAAIWWQADHVSTRTIRTGRGPLRWFAPLLAHWSSILAVLAGLVSLTAAVGLVAAAQTGLGEVGRLLVILGLSGVGLLLAGAPWAIRVRQALAQARDDKLVADARADMAAHLHDSVLQTLALIQRQASDPRAVAALARRQERELRQWLYGETADQATLTAALAGEAADVEDVHGVAVDLVTVGDCELTPDLAALVRAAREAMVNAAKHSGAERVDVYAEVDPGLVAVYVRDRGHGFDLEEIEEDRMGVRGSILERVRRSGGRAIIRTTPGEGTEVRLEMPR